MSVERRSEIDRQHRSGDGEPEQRSDPHADGETHVFASPLGPTGGDSTGRSARGERSDGEPQSRAREHGENPSDGSAHHRHTEKRKGRDRGDREHESGHTTPRRIAADQQHRRDESERAGDSEGDRRPTSANHVTVMSHAVGNGVGWREKDLIESHEEKGYDMWSPRSWQALAVVAGAWIFENGVRSGLVARGGLVVVAVLVAIRVVVHRLGWLPLALIALLVFAGARSSAEWSVFDEPVSGVVRATVRVVGDPVAVGGGTRIVVVHEGKRYEALVHGASSWLVDGLADGTRIEVRGRLREAPSTRWRRLAVKHIVGVIEIDEVRLPRGDPQSRMRGLERSSTVVRDVLGRGAAAMPGDDAALFSGLVYGDDSAQSRDVIERFRASGLAHLTAVSGQNVGYLLVLVAPMLRRRGRWTRLTLTIGVLVWFAVLTRCEPSVVRACGMAGVAAVFMAIGVRSRAIDVLSICVIVFVLIDPLLVWSVGWWLSVAGTFGLISFTPAIHRTIRHRSQRRWLAEWIAPTLAAQIGVFPVSSMVFGWPNVWAIPANLFAAPVAGVVMLVGLPLAAISGLVPVLGGPLMFLPMLAVRWVDRVALVAERLRPSASINAVLLVAGVVVMFVVGRSDRRRCANVVV